MKKIVVVILFGLAALLFFWGSSEKEQTFPYGKPSTEIKIQERKMSNLSDSTRVFVIQSRDVEGEALLTLVSTSEEGQSLVNAEIMGVKTTFQMSRAAYAGHISAVIDCQTQKFVEERTHAFGQGEARVILAVANARRTFGNCSEKEIQYAVAVGAAYDAKSQLVLSVKLYQPVHGPEQIKESQENLLRFVSQIMVPAEEI